MYKFFDGDALIKALDNDVEPFHDKFNYVYNLSTHRHKIPEDTVFIHFAGTAKPWKIWAQDNEQTNIWLRYKNISPWSK